MLKQFNVRQEAWRQRGSALKKKKSYREEKLIVSSRRQSRALRKKTKMSRSKEMSKTKVEMDRI